MSSAREDIPFLLDGGSGYAQDVGAAAELRQMSRSSSPKGVTGAGVQLEPPPPWEDNPASRQQSAASPRSTGGFRPIELKFAQIPHRRLLVFSGGTASDTLARKLAEFTNDVTYVLPISDNGGSSLEIMRVLGGPAIGDIRNRLLSLARRRNTDVAAAVNLLSYRLGPDAREAKMEWQEIVEGRHALWYGVTEDYKHIIRAYLVHFEVQLLRRTSVFIRDASDEYGKMGDPFDFSHGSIGNFFFTGARIFFKSMPSAIRLWSFIADVPASTLVLPVINYNQRLTIGAELRDGSTIRGQNTIRYTVYQPLIPLLLSKGTEWLLSPVRRLFYLNDYGHEVLPPVSEDVLSEIKRSSVITYSMGSLYTSIVPCLILGGVGECVAERDCPKVMCINAYPDRETTGMTISECVAAIHEALRQNESKEFLATPAAEDVLKFVTHVFYCRGCTIENPNAHRLEEMGLCLQEIESTLDPKGRPVFDADSLAVALLSAQL